MSYIPPRHHDVNDWMRMVADAVNPAINGYPFPQHGADPTGVSAGYTFYHIGTNKVRTFNGTSFFDLF